MRLHKILWEENVDCTIKLRINYLKFGKFSHFHFSDHSDDFWRSKCSLKPTIEQRRYFPNKIENEIFSWISILFRHLADSNTWSIVGEVLERRHKIHIHIWNLNQFFDVRKVRLKNRVNFLPLIQNSSLSIQFSTVCQTFKLNTNINCLAMVPSLLLISKYLLFPSNQIYFLFFFRKKKWTPFISE